jgi:hypothetical protein
MNTKSSKRAFRIERTIDSAAESVLFTAYDRNDQLVPGMSLRFEAKRASEAKRHYAMLFGFNQTIGDQAALTQGATLSEKFSAMRERAEFLMKDPTDQWSTGRGPSESSLLFRAMTEAYAWTSEEVQKWITGQKEKAKELKITWATYQSKLLASKKLAEIVDKLRSEEIDSVQVDTDAIFSELDSE